MTNRPIQETEFEASGRTVQDLLDDDSVCVLGGGCGGEGGCGLLCVCECVSVRVCECVCV